jgi:TPR repeat protein
MPTYSAKPLIIVDAPLPYEGEPKNKRDAFHQWAYEIQQCLDDGLKVNGITVFFAIEANYLASIFKENEEERDNLLSYIDLFVECEIQKLAEFKKELEELKNLPDLLESDIQHMEWLESEGIDSVNYSIIKNRTIHKSLIHYDFGTKESLEHAMTHALDFQQHVDLNEAPDGAFANEILGLGFFVGWGVEIDRPKGLKHLLAADVPNAGYNVTHNLGAIFFEGVDAEKDIDRAVAYFTRAAALNRIESIRMLAKISGEGIDVPQDATVSFGWVKKAADLGHVYSKADLGLFYCDGFGTPKDPRKGIALIEEALGSGIETIADQAYVEGLRERVDRYRNQPHT